MAQAFYFFFKLQLASLEFTDAGGVRAGMRHLFTNQLVEFAMSLGKRIEMLLDRHGAHSFLSQKGVVKHAPWHLSAGQFDHVPQRQTNRILSPRSRYPCDGKGAPRGASPARGCGRPAPEGKEQTNRILSPRSGYPCERKGAEARRPALEGYGITPGA